MLAILIATFSLSLSSASDKNLRSTVTAVTVYSDRALVTRSAKESLASGTQTIRFTGLPAGLLDESVKVTGESETETKIQDVRIATIFLDSVPGVRISELARRLETLRRSKDGLDLKIRLILSQVATVDSLRTSYARSVATPGTGQRAMTEEWEKLLQFVERKKTDYQQRIDDLQRQSGTQASQIEAVEQEIVSTHSSSKKIQKDVIVVLALAKEADVRLELSYIIPQAKWVPLYEVRSVAAEPKVQIIYTGNVSQSTGEDWTNIDLTLSTARPVLGSAPPALPRWGVDTRPPLAATESSTRSHSGGFEFSQRASTRMHTISGSIGDKETGEPLVGANAWVQGTTLGASSDINGNFVISNVPTGVHIVSFSYVGYGAVKVKNVVVSDQNGSILNVPMVASSINVQAVEIVAERPIVQRNTTSTVRHVDFESAGTGRALQVRGGRASEQELIAENSTAEAVPTAAVFHISSRQSLPTDNQPHRVGIAVEDLPVTYSYETIPKMIPAVFLNGKGKNTTNYPFLAGPANVFFQNSFIATAQMPSVMPADSFSVDFGIDDAVKVERKMLRRFTEIVGTFSRSTRITYAFEITLTNLRNHEVSVAVRDHVPVSSDEKITVQILPPTSEHVKPDADGAIVWFCQVQSGAKQVIPLSFSVESPVDTKVYGLE